MSVAVPAPSRSVRTPLLVLALVGAVGVMALQLAQRPGRLLELPLYDYTAFWAAARLNLDGADPYDPGRLEVLQRQADPAHGDTLVMWPAPWALTLLMPLARFDAPVSHLLWLTLSLAVLLVAVYGAWRVYGGAAEDAWVAGAVTFAFVPTYAVLVTGQLGAFLLLGLVGFLYFLRQGRPGWAGAALVLTAIKPQLTFLFWVVLLLWAVERRSWRLVLGGLAGTAAALAWPLWENPSLLGQYWYALTARTQTHSHLSPVLGTGLRLIFGLEHFWLQFVPTVPGVLWAVGYYVRHRRTWEWSGRLPALLFASFLTASYGAWPFDLVVLLLPLLGRAVQLRAAPLPVARWAVAGFAAVNALALAQLLAQAEYFWFLWMTPALALGYGATGRALAGRDGRAASAEIAGDSRKIPAAI